MIRRAFLLGFFSVVGQVLLLRELVASLNGDELFISTALFGWLISVAAGAYLGGRSRTSPGALFWRGAVLLPVMVLLVRFSPMLTDHMTGEVIPFTQAALISMVAMLPIGIISGWLFPSIARQQMETEPSIIRVYLFEGIGAFLGGILVAFAIGPWLSGLQLAFAVGLFIALFDWMFAIPSWNFRLRRLLLMVVVVAIFLVGVGYLEPVADQWRYRPYQVEKSFDTPYGRQTILSREDNVILLTDNSVEAVYPSTMAAENALIPALVYHPDAETIAYVGQTEFGISQLAEEIFGGSNLVAIDPRQQLSEVIDGIISTDHLPVHLYVDPGIMMTPIADDHWTFDIVIIAAGMFDTYKNGRLVTPSFFEHLPLNPGGMVVIPTGYDTDRYIGNEQAEILSVIRNTLSGQFHYTEVWPGTSTVFFASDSSRFGLPVDSIIARIDSLDYNAQFVSRDYLPDRLDDLSRDRLLAAMGQYDAVNSIDKPILPYLQALLRSKVDSADHLIITQILTQPLWLLIFPVVLIILFVTTIIPKRAKGKFALFLFFTAGVVSLSLELISFYVFQSYAGALYWAMAVLIGAFMLGLSLGTVAVYWIKSDKTASVALIVLMVLTLGFLFTYENGTIEFAVFYHAGFLLLTAAASGALFVGATRQYYGRKAKENRGTGYALEIAGSSLGALFSTAVLLPVIGLTYLLIAIAAVSGIALLGLIIRR
ncbi:MAG: hypothetical protein AB1483_12135 [Candidatus Zixiibacteriota bacterium]